ncbi:rCG55702 [Rattus norvegicus]|uniref:RCG55702 n=1 Tax=Rattus norvegicus TaxID=10116 RepID=A6JQK9_RAT|nr:rCG55702 [Rattus norvegicus]
MWMRSSQAEEECMWLHLCGVQNQA